MYSAAQFRDKLVELANTRIAHFKDELPNIAAHPDYASYTGKASRIAGLSLIEELCDEAHDILSKR